MTSISSDQPESKRPDPSEPLWILVIDDDRISSHNLSILFRFVGETPVLASSETWADTLRMLSQGDAKTFLLAAAIGHVNKQRLPDVLLRLHEQRPTLPVLLLGAADAELAAVLPDATRAALPESLRERLMISADGALNYERLLQALNRARAIGGFAPVPLPSKLISPTGTAMFRSLSGRSGPITRVRGLLQQVASRETLVLVRGESGTGKEIVARNLHYHSGRSGKPFIAVNCAALAPERNGSELFGLEQGYHGAAETKVGFVEQADGGTIFLDEVAELPANVQALLLRFLEDRQFQRVGGHELLGADVRIVAATRQNLEVRMKEGKFREDLYYRLSVVPIELPPLRKRLEDVPELVKELISSLENRGQASVRFNSSALQSLQQHQWPGNVRELANLVERLGILHPNAVLGVSDLPPEYQYAVPEEATDAAAPAPEIRAGKLSLVPAAAGTDALPSGDMPPLNEERLQQYLDNFERQLIEVALDDSAGLIDFAAERLQVDGATLRAMMQAHGISVQAR